MHPPRRLAAAAPRRVEQRCCLVFVARHQVSVQIERLVQLDRPGRRELAQMRRRRCPERQREDRLQDRLQTARSDAALGNEKARLSGLFLSLPGLDSNQQPSG